MLNRIGNDFTFTLKIKFTMNVPVSQCADEWESEEVAAEMFDLLANRIAEAFDNDCDLLDTDRFEHVRKGDVYEVISTYIFEVVVRGDDYDDATEWLNSYLEDVDVPADVKMVVKLLECVCVEPALAVIGE